MRPALTLLIVAAGALLIRYAFLGRNPWDDVLTVVKGQPSTPISLSGIPVVNPTGTPEADSAGGSDTSTRIVRGVNQAV